MIHFTACSRVGHDKDNRKNYWLFFPNQCLVTLTRHHPSISLHSRIQDEDMGMAGLHSAESILGYFSQALRWNMER